MLQTILRIAATAFIAGVIAIAITAAPAANNGAAKPSLPFAKADRFSVALKGTACSQHGWPYFEPKCQFDVRETAGEARTIRVITLR